jgi:hypothetical protein
MLLTCTNVCVRQTPDKYRERMRCLVAYEQQQIVRDIEKYDMFEANRYAWKGMRTGTMAYTCTCSQVVCEATHVKMFTFELAGQETEPS